MNNDKWLCTAKVFQKEDGGYRASLEGQDDIDQATLIKIFILMAEDLRDGIADNRLDVLPTTPKTT